MHTWLLELLSGHGVCVYLSASIGIQNYLVQLWRQHFLWLLINRVAAWWIIFFAHSVNEINVSRGIFITEDHFSCVGWCKSFAAMRLLWDRQSRPFSVSLFSRKPAVYYKSKLAARQYDGMSLFPPVYRRNCFQYLSLHVCLLAWLFHFLTCLLECPPAFLGLSALCVFESQTDHNPPSLLVVCHLHLIKY